MDKTNIGSVNPKTQRVTEADLNLTQQLNSVANLNYKGEYPNINGKYMVNALAPNKLPFKGEVVLGSGEDVESSMHSYMWFLTNRICASMYSYEGLPKKFNNIAYEKRLVQNGRIYIIKISEEEFLSVNAIPTKTDIYEDAIEIQITEPKSKLDGKILKYDQFAEIYANSYKLPITMLYNWIVNPIIAYRHRLDIETFSTIPKLAMVNGYQDNVNGNQVKAENHEQFMRSDKIIASETFKLDNAATAVGNLKDSAYIDLSLEDRRERTTATYDYLMNLYKEHLGMTQSGMNEAARDRTTSAHVESAQGINSVLSKEGFDCRQKGWDRANELFGLNVVVIDNSAQMGEEEESEDKEGEDNE